MNRDKWEDLNIAIAMLKATIAKEIKISFPFEIYKDKKGKKKLELKD